MSPIARLLDWLSNKYHILFVVSAGNHPEIIEYVDLDFDELKSLDIEERSRIFGRAINENRRNLKVLAPAESLNCISVGAIYDDYSNSVEDNNRVFAVEKGLPSPISSVGKGYRSIITPDLYYHGGREFITKNRIDNSIKWVESSRKPGCASAAPTSEGDINGIRYSFGTSDAAAQLTHEAAKCHDVLKQIFMSETGKSIPHDMEAVILKAMLTHGATWENLSEKVAKMMEGKTKRLSEWLGNGVPDVNKVIECTKERITLIGLGALNKDEGNIFRLPLPIDFSSRRIRRKLTVTLAYFSPIVANKQSYRSAKLWFDLIGKGGKLVPNRQNTDYNEVKRGTLQHEIFTGYDAVAWNNDDLVIKVSCNKDAENIKEKIQYCIFVSFEIAKGFDIDLYSEVLSKIHQKIEIPDIENVKLLLE